MKAPYTLSLLVLAACAGSPATAPLGQPEPGLEERYQQAEAAGAKASEFHRVLLTLDKTLDSYVQTLANKGVPRADRQRENLQAHLRKTVEEHYDQLVAAARDSSVPANQGIALAALGFADRVEHSETMAVLLDGLQSPDPFLVDKAVLGLALLQDPRTPPGLLMDIIDNEELPDRSRIQAAWALHQIQMVSPRRDEIVAYWKKLLERPLTAVHEGVVAQAVRGIGLTRDPQLAPVVTKYASHSTAKVREMAAIALGRMKNPDSIEVLLALLGPAETNPNVRLAARKALQALAGGIDRGYDVEEWRKVFDLGR